MNRSTAKTGSDHNNLKRIAVILAFLICLASILALIGYWTDAELLYRPVKNGPATNPFTAIGFLLAGLYILIDMSRYTEHPLKPLLLLAVFSAALLKLIDYLTGSHAMVELSPFYYDVISEMNDGKSNSMGLNTSLMYFAVSLALVSKGFKKYLLSQSLSTVAIAIPSVAVLGYLVKLDNLYGEMSPLTAVLGILLALSVLASTAGHGFIRTVQRPHEIKDNGGD